MNETLFLLINANNESPAFLRNLALFSAEYLLYIVPFTLLVMWCWSNRRETALRALCVCLIALGLGQVISALYFHPRPFMVPIGHTFAQHAADASFPSDHGLLMFSVSFAFLLCREWMLGSAMFAIGLLIAWSRIYLGIHFPFDMLGSALVSATACGIVWRAWSMLGTRLMAMAESLYQQLFSFAISRNWMKS